MARELVGLLRLTYYTMDYGLVLYEGILDYIDIRVDGEPRHRIDIRGMLAKAPDDNCWGLTQELILARKKRFEEWSAWVAEWRRQAREGKELRGERPSQYII